MTIRDDEDAVSDVAVGELLAQPLRIPHYQRPYSWEPETALQLVEDIEDARAAAAGDETGRAAATYVLGAVILHREKNEPAGEDQLNVVDGQQRLLTLLMLCEMLAERDSRVPSEDPETAVGRVRQALGRRLGPLSDPGRAELLRFVRNQVRVVRVVTDDLDEAFRVFDSQNYRGKPLVPHDLLKAYHLREMRDETPALKAAVVQTWESVSDQELDRLFSTYLYRIARWTRGQNAPRFTVQDIGIFKGIASGGELSPNSRYHLAAQAAVPMLGAWSSTGSSPGQRDAEIRELNRSRFQFDAPLTAGQPFFEMVSFMLDELRYLAQRAFDFKAGSSDGEGGAGAEAFNFYRLQSESGDSGSCGHADAGLEELPAQSRYRYVCELYLASLLYYVNKFGDRDLERVREQLFAWAYAPRVDLLRVQYRSVDNRGRGDDQSPSAFRLLRDADSSNAVRRLTPRTVPPHKRHEEELVRLLDGLGAGG